MGRPQQPELARSAKTDLDPDHVETGLQGQRNKPAPAGETGPVPPDNQAGHHPPEEQDKPDLDAFAARLGTDPKAPAATSARKGPAPRKTAPAKAASRPAAANPKKSAAVLAPTREEAAQFSAPQPEPEEQGESRLVGFALLPLRETVKRLEQLERKLTERLAKGGRGSRGR
jgi:hypothetical protein